VAGGIGLDTIDAVVALEPAIIVVGSAITKAADPAEAARAIREAMRKLHKVPQRMHGETQRGT
jgi:3-hexulose-6-phosphate synthase